MVCNPLCGSHHNHQGCITISNLFPFLLLTLRHRWSVYVATPFHPHLTYSIHRNSLDNHGTSQPLRWCRQSEPFIFIEPGSANNNFLRLAAFAQRTRKARLLLTCGAIHLVPPPASCGVGARYYRIGTGRQKRRMREKSGSRRWQGMQESNLRYEGQNLMPYRLANPLCNALEAFGESGDTPIPFLERHPRFSATPVPGGGGVGVGPPLSPAPSLTCTPWGAGYPCSAARADTPIYCGLKTAYCEYSMQSLSLIAPQWFASSFNSIESLFC